MENFWSFYSKDIKETNKRVDLSSCFLVEASGDSEIDFDPNNNNKPSKDLEAGDDDDNDAESCSCDVSYCCYYSCVGNFNGCEVEESSVLVNSDNNNKNNNRENQETQQQQKEEEEEVHGYQEWDDGQIGLSVNQKSCVSVESTNEPMNETEKNRLFWETCLAS